MFRVFRNNKMDEKQEAQLELTKRTNRRRMAWSSLIAMFIVMASALFLLPPEKSKALEEIITLFFIANASIVAGYFGFSAWMSRR